MQRREGSTLGCGLVIVYALLLSVSVLMPSRSFDARAEPARADSSPFAEIAPPAIHRVDRPIRAQSTGETLNLETAPASEGFGPPGDPPFDPNVRVWGDTNEQSRPSLVISPINDRAYVAFQHFNGADWDIVLYHSNDGGTTWTFVLGTVGAGNETNPSLAVTSSGAFVLTWQDDANPDLLPFAHSYDDGLTWSSWTLDVGSVIAELSDIQFPSVVAQRVPGSYPDGIMFQMGAWCDSAANCDGGAHSVFWVGEQNANQDVTGWSFGLGGSYWLTSAAPGGPNFVIDPLHPGAWWGSADYSQVMDMEETDGTEWVLLWICFSEDGTTPTNGYVSTAVSSDGLYGAGAESGMNAVVAGTFRLSTAPTRHQIIYFYTNDGWITTNENALDSAATDQRAISVTGLGTTFHVAYYSNTTASHMAVETNGAMTGPERVSDNTPATAVNDDKATSVFINSTGGLVVAWQDNRDGNVNIYATIGLSSAPGNDTTGPITRYPTVIPNPYIRGVSTSLRVQAEINDAMTGGSNISEAWLVLTDTTVSDPSSVDWTNSWAMNLTGRDRRPIEAAWLWANETAAGWPEGSCHRFWIRGRDSRGNWGLGNHVDVCSLTLRVPLPPSMTKAQLTGSGYKDVTLTWSRSPDDVGGPGQVSVYKVSRSEKIQGPFTVIANVTATGSPVYSWTDSGVGHGDSRHLFYRVTAGNPSYESAPTRLAGKFSRTLSGAKQLVSFPLEQANYDPVVVFQTISYEYVRTYVAGTPNPWWCHKPGLFISSLTQLSIKQGYWVQMNGPGTMTVTGLVPQNTSMVLMSGWNMIGFPSYSTSYTFADMDAELGGLLQLVEAYDASAGPYYLQKVLRKDWATTYLGAGHAYMVRVSSDASWVIPGL